MTASVQTQWACHPKSEAILLHLLNEYCQTNPAIARLQEDLQQFTSTRLFDWIDHLVIRTSPHIEKELQDDGFVFEGASPTYRIFHHPGAQFPRVVVHDDPSDMIGVAVSVENIADFLMVRGMHGLIEGTPLGLYRRSCVSIDNGVGLWAVERRGTHIMEPTHMEGHHVDKYIAATEMWETRPRALDDEDEAMKITLDLAQDIIDLVGQEMAAWIVLECERKYWQSRNVAGQLQKNRQDRLGMGWANHDHHTFRSSRKHFGSLVRLFEMLGFYCREKFYAGQEAGWGAQVMEHQRTRLVLFLDVDLTPDEVQVDFRTHSLPELKELHTVGLWCALHGDSILKAGMHHLEAQFLFEDLKQDLDVIGIKMMDPFSSLPHLKQAFTKGEMWKVDPKRIENLLKKKVITQEQANKFKENGAIGSHMENLQRREGYKGFNPRNVSSIIRTTDPRNINF